MGGGTAGDASRAASCVSSIFASVSQAKVRARSAISVTPRWTVVHQRCDPDTVPRAYIWPLTLANTANAPATPAMAGSTSSTVSTIRARQSASAEVRAQSPVRTIVTAPLWPTTSLSGFHEPTSQTRPEQWRRVWWLPREKDPRRILSPASQSGEATNQASVRPLSLNRVQHSVFRDFLVGAAERRSGEGPHLDHPRWLVHGVGRQAGR